MEKKYEYKLRDEKYIYALDKLTKGFINQSTKFPISDEFYSTSISILNQLNVLDLFFEKVEAKELPIIGGDRVIYNYNWLHIAGEDVHKDWVVRSGFKSFTLNNGTHVSESDVKQIREYLKQNKE